MSNKNIKVHKIYSFFRIYTKFSVKIISRRHIGLIKVGKVDFFDQLWHMSKEWPRNGDECVV